MKKNYIIIFSLIIILTMGIIFTDYAKQLGTILADASVPNPGHPLIEIEGSEELATKTYVNDALVGITGSNWTVSGDNIYRPSGNVGIGVSNPTSELEVSGGIKLGSSSTVCNLENEGLIKYEQSEKNFLFCNGTEFYNLPLTHPYPVDVVLSEANTITTCCRKEASVSGYTFTYEGGGAHNGCRSTYTTPIPWNEVFKITYEYSKPSGYDENLRYHVGVRMVVGLWETGYSCGDGGLGYHYPPDSVTIWSGLGTVNSSNYTSYEIVVNAALNRWRINGVEREWTHNIDGSGSVHGPTQSYKDAAIASGYVYPEIYTMDYGNYPSYIRNVTITRNVSW